MQLSPSILFPTFPSLLRDELYCEFNKILRNYREARWEPTELDGGRLCEIVYTIIDGYTKGVFPQRSSKPRNFIESCKNLEHLDQVKFCRSIRIQIPRVLIPLYEFRNNRGVGHMGGDVNPNEMDSTYVLYSSKWLLAELIRIFHQVDIKTATSTVDRIIQRESQAVWDMGEIKRVLKQELDYTSQVLLLLYNSNDGTATDSLLFEWVEYSNKSSFKSRILKKAHSERLIEYTPSTGVVKISPLGINLIEDQILKNPA